MKGEAINEECGFLGFGITICSIIAIVIVMTLWGINIRQNELNNAVNGAFKGNY